jgi:hypothetical protein
MTKQSINEKTMSDFIATLSAMNESIDENTLRQNLAGLSDAFTTAVDELMNNEIIEQEAIHEIAIDHEVSMKNMARELQELVEYEIFDVESSVEDATQPDEAPYIDANKEHRLTGFELGVAS